MTPRPHSLFALLLSAALGVCAANGPSPRQAEIRRELLAVDQDVRGLRAELGRLDQQIQASHSALDYIQNLDAAERNAPVVQRMARDAKQRLQAAQRQRNQVEAHLARSLETQRSMRGLLAQEAELEALEDTASRELERLRDVQALESALLEQTRGELQQLAASTLTERDRPRLEQLVEEVARLEERTAEYPPAIARLDALVAPGAQAPAPSGPVAEAVDLRQRTLAGVAEARSAYASGVVHLNAQRALLELDRARTETKRDQLLALTRESQERTLTPNEAAILARLPEEVAELELRTAERERWVERTALANQGVEASAAQLRSLLPKLGAASADEGVEALRLTFGAEEVTSRVDSTGITYTLTRDGDRVTIQVRDFPTAGAAAEARAQQGVSERWGQRVVTINDPSVLSFREAREALDQAWSALGVPAPQPQLGMPAPQPQRSTPGILGRLSGN